MIKECVGFVERYGYIRSESLRGKSRTSLCEFLVEDILLSSIGSEDLKKPKIYVFFPFNLSLDKKLTLNSDRVFTKSSNNEPIEFSEEELKLIESYNEDERKDFNHIVENTQKHLDILSVYDQSDFNKRIGYGKSTLSSVIYAFKLTTKSKPFEKALNELLKKDKLDKFVYKQQNLDMFNSIGPEIKSYLNTPAWKKLSQIILEKKNMAQINKKINPPEIFFISILPSQASFKEKNILPSESNYRSVYSLLRVEFLKYQSTVNPQETDAECMCCQEQKKVDAPVLFCSYSSRKPFSEHLTRRPKDKSFLICGECALLYRLFFDYVKKNKIKIMPLFIDSALQKKEIWLITKKGVNSFQAIFNQMQKNIEYDFFLFLFKFWDNEKKKRCFELLFYDYIFNYKWNIGQYYVANGCTKKYATRAILESKLRVVLGITSYFPYFEKLDKKAPWQIYLFNSINEKLFNFVYRNRCLFDDGDFLNLTIIPIEQIALSDAEKFWKPDGIVNIALDLWFNKNLFCNEKRREIMKIDELLKKSPESCKEAWAFHAGRFYRFLVKKSKAGVRNERTGKNLELESIIGCNQIKRVRLILGDKFENRSYAVKEDEIKTSDLSLDVILASDDYDQESFRALKPYFYAGYIYQLKKY